MPPIPKETTTRGPLVADKENEPIESPQRKPWSLYLEALGLDEEYVLNRIRDRIDYPESTRPNSRPSNPPTEPHQG
jgi:hypothetical protein